MTKCIMSEKGASAAFHQDPCLVSDDTVEMNIEIFENDKFV